MDNSPNKHLPICITPGDPSGIGPEVTAKFLATLKYETSKKSVEIIGDCEALHSIAEVFCIDLPTESDYPIQYHQIDAELPGDISYQAIERAVQRISEKKTSVLVTGPISKANLHLAGHHYGGHTEILETLANRYFSTEQSVSSYQADMLFVHHQFRMLLLTRHIALRDVSQALKAEQIVMSLNNLISFLKEQVGLTHPRLGILGVNPHAGEMQSNETFCEERDILSPILQRVSSQWNISIDPPLAADAAFRGFDPKRPAYDCYVAAYHDQGLIPMKLVAGMQAVNVTIGLPFIRTSVSHGTAPDIAGKGIADPSALRAAFRLAEALMT